MGGEQYIAGLLSGAPALTITVKNLVCRLVALALRRRMLSGAIGLIQASHDETIDVNALNDAPIEARR